MKKLLTIFCALLGFGAIDSVAEGTVYTYDFTDGIDIANAECLAKNNSTGLVSSDANTNNAIAYFTTNSVTTTADGADGVLELYGAKNGKDNGPYAGDVNDDDTTPVIWTSGKTQSSSSVWYDYFKINVPSDYEGKYITISVDYISGSNSSDRYLVVADELSDISSEEVDAINSHLASSVSSGQSAANKATTTYYGTDALEGTEAFYLIASNNVGVYSITVTFSTEAPTGTSTTVAVAEPEPTEIEGYLTVTMGSTNLLDNEATTIVVTEDADAGTTTVAVPAELSILTMTVTDLSVTFTAVDGAFTDGVASFKLSSTEQTVESIAGTFVTTEDGVTTFESTIAVYGDISIVVSFTTVAPATEPEWTLIATEENYVTDETKWVGENNYQLTFTFEELEGYEYIKIVGTTYTSTDDLSYETWNDWGAIQLGQDWTVFGDKFSYDYTTADQEPIIASIAEIQAACAGDATEFYIALWGNTIAVSVYVSGEATTESGSGESSGSGEVVEEDPIADWQLELVAYGVGWGGSYTGLYSSEQVDGVITNSATIAELIAVETNPTSVADLGGVMVKLGGVVADQIVDYTITCTGASIAVEGQAVVGSTNYPIDEWGYITLGQFDTPAVHEQWGGIYTFSETYVFTATVELGTAGIDTGIASVASDVEVVEVARYNLMGQKISGAEKGINIIVYSDGSAKKVLVK